MTDTQKTILINETVKAMAKANGVSEEFVNEQIEAKNPKAVKQFSELVVKCMTFLCKEGIL